jgi:hypothetical protein
MLATIRISYIKQTISLSIEGLLWRLINRWRLVAPMCCSTVIAMCDLCPRQRSKVCQELWRIIHIQSEVALDIKWGTGGTNQIRSADTQLGDDGDVDSAMGNVMPCEWRIWNDVVDLSGRKWHHIHCFSPSCASAPPFAFVFTPVPHWLVWTWSTDCTVGAKDVKFLLRKCLERDAMKNTNSFLCRSCIPFSLECGRTWRPGIICNPSIRGSY